MSEVQSETENLPASSGHADPEEPSGEVAEIPDVLDQQPPQTDRNLELVMQIPVSVDAVLGSTNMPVSRLMRLGRGSVVALDRKVGEPIDVVVNGRVIARGEVVLLEDGSSTFGISLTEIVNAAGQVANTGNS